jgi:hypothetical protein
MYGKMLLHHARGLSDGVIRCCPMGLSDGVVRWGCSMGLFDVSKSTPRICMGQLPPRYCVFFYMVELLAIHQAGKLISARHGGLLPSDVVAITELKRSRV